MKGINLVLEEHGVGDRTQACESVRFPEGSNVRYEIRMGKNYM